MGVEAEEAQKAQGNAVTGVTNEAASRLASLSLSTSALHVDDDLDNNQDVAPAMHLSTTFYYNKDPDALRVTTSYGPDDPYPGHVYSRHTTPNTTRLEAILSSLLKGPSLTYSSGLSAFHALLVLLNPKRISIGEGYHGCHGVIEVHKKLTGLKKLNLDCAAEELEAGDIIHVETPLNPTGEARNLKAFADKAHSRGAYLTVDATFAPPPLQDPFLWGADIVMHSGTKYVGGHSDLLCGILAVNPVRAKEGWFDKLFEERLFLGSVMGSVEGWLGVRSIRTLELRVERQSYNTGKLVKWLQAALHLEKEGASVIATPEESKIVQAVLEKVVHASLQEDDLKDGWLQKQMPVGFGPVFSIIMKTEKLARYLPSKLLLFHHATSLGSVASLIEWRTMTDSTVDKRLLRVSVGIEAWEDLKTDFLESFKALGALTD